jgi:hypothetical protein
MEKSTKTILSGVRELYDQLVWTHKVHEKCADRYKRYDDSFKIAQIVLSVLLAAGGISAITEYVPDTWKMWIGLLVAILSFALTMINSFLKNRNYAQWSVDHADIAKKLWSCRVRTLAILADAQAGKLTDEDIIQKRDAMIEEWSQINEKAPRTSPEDYETAKKALKENGEMSCPEQEIDALLPKELRWSEEDKQ